MLSVGLFLGLLCIAGVYAYLRLAGSKPKWRAAENCIVAAKMYSDLVEEDKVRINGIVLRRLRQMGISGDKGELVRMINENEIARALLYSKVFSETGVLPSVFIVRWGWSADFQPFKTLTKNDREYKFTVAKYEKATGLSANLSVGPFVAPE
jgi:hypothetical protein